MNTTKQRDKPDYYAIFNPERQRFLTSAEGIGVWHDKRSAKTVMHNEFAGADHLEVVEVSRIDS